MVNYQTTIQHPKYIRWGSATVEVYDTASSTWVNLGAIKSLSSTITTTGEQEYAPDNAAPIKIDPVPKTWDFTFELQEAWNMSALKLLRGDVDVYATDMMHVYAGIGARPHNKIRITNTTAGVPAAIITLSKVKTMSELDWMFQSDTNSTAAIALPIKLSAEIDGNNGFGTVYVPHETGTVTITPASVSITVGATQAMTVTGATTKSFGTTNVGVATVSATGVVTGVAEGNTRLLIDCDGVTHIVPVSVTAA